MKILNRSIKTLLLAFMALSLSSVSFGDEEHHEHKGHAMAKKKVEVKKDDHDHDHKDEKKHDDHKDEPKDEHKDDHGDHDEHSEEGFSLDEHAQKTFELSFLDVEGQKIDVPKGAIYRGLMEVGVYRVRDNKYKRVSISILSNNKQNLKISSTELAKGDKIVISGVGFLRIAEIAAAGGLQDSHSH